MDKLLAEKSNISICKYVLGVNKYACNAAVVGELGRFPVWFSMVKQNCKFWLRLVNQPENSLLGLAYKENISMNAKGVDSWVTGVINMLRDYNELPPTNEFVKGNFDIQRFISVVEERYLKFWTSNIEKNKKLILYKEFKKEFHYEDYLNVDNEKHRGALCKLRISAHKLAIEVGRHQQSKLPVDARLCKVCNRNSVENEIHFLVTCDRYAEIRKDIFGENLSQFTGVVERVAFMDVIGNGDCRLLAKFCHRAFNARE